MKSVFVAIKILAVVFGIIGLVVGIELYRHPPDPLRHCQKQIICAFDQWPIDNHTNVYPNVVGNGMQSFLQVGEYLKLTGYINDYAYVPGLRSDDPNDLVLMYLKEKTRRTWNGDRRYNRHTEKMWMVFGPVMYRAAHGDDLPEGGTRETTLEFKRRFQKTLSFLKENNRPYWENVVKEHTEFLNSIKE
ncbi:MAG: hypothetical protein HYV36_05200 [Lentisphaerae bacterium]|nr:hypothetical protein [Lentisphaerota bacterium]